MMKMMTRVVNIIDFIGNMGSVVQSKIDFGSVTSVF